MTLKYLHVIRCCAASTANHHFRHHLNEQRGLMNTIRQWSRYIIRERLALECTMMCRDTPYVDSISWHKIAKKSSKFRSRADSLEFSRSQQCRDSSKALMMTNNTSDCFGYVSFEDAHVFSFRISLQMSRYLGLILVFTAFTHAHQGAKKCEGGGLGLKYVWGDALTDSDDCVGPNNMQYPS